MRTIEELLLQNRFDMADALLRKRLGAEPDDVPAARLLGRLALHRGNAAEAIRLFERVARVAPDEPGIHYELGVALLATDHLTAAVDAFRQELARQPAHGDLLYNLGWALRRLGHNHDAADTLRQATAFNPSFAPAWFNLGNALADLNRVEEACCAFEQALAAAPDDTDACNNFGLALRRLGRTDRALDMFRRALALSPLNAKAANNLGNALNALGRGQEAIDAYLVALRGTPGDVEVVVNLALCLGEHQREDEASTLLDQALATTPNSARLWNALGVQQLAVNRTTEATESFRHAIALDPGSVEAWNNLGKALSVAGRGAEATAAFRHALDLDPDNANLHSNLIFHLLHLQDVPVEEFAAEARRYGQRQERVTPLPPLPRPSPREAGRRLRVGYISPDFREHAVSLFFEPYLEHRHPVEFETYCYSLHARPDPVTARLRALADHWRDISELPSEQAAHLIRADKIDILVDLAGHTAGNRLPIFAYKPAPIQATWFGYPGTTGLTRIDYRLTDPVTHPPGSEALFSERLFRSRVGICFRPPADRPPIPPPPSLISGKVRFGSFNKLQKINPEVMRAWATILDQVPGSELVVIAPGATSPAIIDGVRSRLAAEGISAERVIVQGMLPVRKFLALVTSVDVALDPWPYSGGTTSGLTLLMGVPLIAMATPGIAGSSVGVLRAAGLSGLVATNVAEYVETALHVAGDTAWRADFRRRIPRELEWWWRGTELMTVRHQEAIYRFWWEAFVNGREVDCSVAYMIEGGPYTPYHALRAAEQGLSPPPVEGDEKIRLIPVPLGNDIELVPDNWAREGADSQTSDAGGV